jgi:type IV pilus assembly protein PilM
MAEIQTTVALNIGSQRVSMAIFEISKNGGLTLRGYDSESLVADPALEAGRIAQVRVAVADLYARLKPGKVKVRYAISGQAVFTRFVKLPPLKDENIEQLVTFEAQQHVPFPLNEVVWDYELIEGTGDKEVVMVAIKSDALDEINQAVNDSGLGTQEVDVSPMALYNAFHATYGVPEEPTLLIDIGAKTSNLLYIEGRRFFTRSVAIGGVSVTAAIAKEYGVSFAEAEYQKVTNGLVALGGGHTEQLEEAVAALAMVIRNALGRLPAEIARTTNYYRSQHGGSAPRRVLLAGGGANLPYTLEFFEEKLNLPVDYFNPVSNVAIGKGMDADLVRREGHLMGELVGLGLRAIGKSDINIDLVPVVVELARAADRRKPFFIAAAAILLAGTATWAVMANTAASRAEDEARTVVEKRDALSPVKIQMDRLVRREKDLVRIAESYVQMEQEHTFWIDLLVELKDAFASDAVWLTEMDPIHDYDVMRVLKPSAQPPSGPNGVSVVRDEFANVQYGSSAMAQIQAAEPTKSKAKGKNAASSKSEAGPTVNAVRIRGFWRDNPRSHNIVSDLIKGLRQKSVNFRFEIKDLSNKSQVIDLSDDQNLSRILTIDSVPAKPGDLGMGFEITLPLAREVSFK